MGGYYGFVAVLLAAAPAFAQSADSLTGWCMLGDECTGPVPLSPSGFYTCEENGTLKNPVRVRGMDSTLFDVECVGDNARYSHRMLFITYKGASGEGEALVVLPDGPRQLERC